MPISQSIFKAYDIRGVVEQELTPEAVKLIGLAIGVNPSLKASVVLWLGAMGASAD